MSITDHFENSTDLLVLSHSPGYQDGQAVFIAGMLGLDRGKRLGAAVVTPNTSDEAVCQILIAYSSDPDSHPEPLDSMETVREVLGRVGVSADERQAEKVLAVYSEAFNDGYRDTILTSIRSRMESKGVQR